MRKILFLFAVVLLAAQPTVYSQKPKQFFKVGEDFYENGKYQDAIDQFSKAIDVDPDYENAYEARAVAHEALGNYSEAAEDYEKLSIFDDKNEEAFFNIGRMYFLLGQNEKALGYVNTALEVKRIYEEAQQLKVSILIEMEKYNDALEMSKEALRYRESDINYFNYARVNEMVGLWDVALDA
jgi:tetratricopeptide (TPR) repeat protein